MTDNPSIHIVAGSGTGAFSGDYGPGVCVALNGPHGIAVDSDGNLYIADYGNHRVRLLDAETQQLATVAGNGVAGFNGDNQPAAYAQLCYPYGVAVDSTGDLYIADYTNQRVRRVNAGNGQITTVAGTGVAGFGGDGGPAATAQLYGPVDVAVDSDDNLYIADFNNQRVRRVDAASRQITTVAGTGVAGFNGDNQPATTAQLHSPYGVAVDSDDNLYIADFNNQRVRRVDARSGQITTVAGTGVAGFNGDNQSATTAQLYSPIGVAVDAGGNLYIADYGNQRVRRVDSMTRQITTIAGTGVADFNGDGGPAAYAHLKYPFGVAVDSDGRLYVSEMGNHRVRKVSGVAGVSFSVSPGGPPDVRLERGGKTGYPGVNLSADQDDVILPQTVRVELPPDRGLRFVGEPQYQLSVQPTSGEVREYHGTLSPDKQALLFTKVNLGLRGKGTAASAWVAVQAPENARLGDTRLHFHIGGQISNSTPVIVVDRPVE